MQSFHLLVLSAAGPKLHSVHNNICRMLTSYYMTIKVTFSSLFQVSVPEVIGNLDSVHTFIRYVECDKPNIFFKYVDLYWILDA